MLVSIVNILIQHVAHCSSFPRYTTSIDSAWFENYPFFSLVFLSFFLSFLSWKTFYIQLVVFGLKSFQVLWKFVSWGLTVDSCTWETFRFHREWIFCDFSVISNSSEFAKFETQLHFLLEYFNTSFRPPFWENYEAQTVADSRKIS